jgi:hypothetical protein
MRAPLIPSYHRMDRLTPSSPRKKTNFEPPENAATQSIQEISLNASKHLAFTNFSLVLARIRDSNVLPHCHAWMAFLSHIINSVPAVRLIENEFPWRRLIEMLNELRVSYNNGNTESVTPGHSSFTRQSSILTHFTYVFTSTSFFLHT